MNRIVRVSRACLVSVILMAGCSHEPKTTALLSSQSAFDELRAAVTREIRDPDRAAKGVILVDQLEQVMIEASNDRKAHVDRIRALNADYDATEEDFRAMFREFNTKRSDRQARIIDINQQAKNITTSAEWKALVKIEEKIVKQTLEAKQEM